MKHIRFFIITMMLSCAIVFPSFAGAWQQDAKGWWYQNDDSTCPKSAWAWLDGDNNGVSECYYFDSNGYCLMNTTTPDQKKVNEAGAWIVDGVVQTRVNTAVPAETTKAAVPETKAPASTSTTKTTAAKSGISATPYDGYTIVVNTSSKKYHKPSCSSVGDMKDKNKGYCSDESYLDSHGYAPCKRCH